MQDSPVSGAGPAGWRNRHLTRQESSTGEERARATERSKSAPASPLQLEIYKQRKLQIRSTCDKYGLTGGSNATGAAGAAYRDMQGSFPWPTEKSLMYQSNWHL